MKRAAVLLTAMSTIVLLSACNPGGQSSPDERVVVVTSSTVFGDIIGRVAGDHAEVHSLVPANGDVHTFEPTAEDARIVASADLIVMNGLGLDDWLEGTVASAAPEGTPILKLGDAVAAADLLPGEEPGEENPHLWMDVEYARRYVERIGRALREVDPANERAYLQATEDYDTRLGELDAWIRDQVATIPEQDRKLVTFHDAFPYFARAYGIEIVGVAVDAPGQDPSAGEIAALIDAIRAAGVKAIFSEAQFPTRVVDQIAAESGATVVADLYDDSLGDPPVTSYEALMRWDTEQLVDALTDGG